MWGASHVHANRIEHQHGPGKKRDLSGLAAPVCGALVYILAYEIYILEVVARFHQALAYFVNACEFVTFL